MARCKCVMPVFKGILFYLYFVIQSDLYCVASLLCNHVTVKTLVANCSQWKSMKLIKLHEIAKTLIDAFINSNCFIQFTLIYTQGN